MIPSIGSSGPQGSRGASAADETAKTGAAAKKRPAAASDGQDRVTLSPVARDLQVLRAHVNDGAADRAVKVAALKERVARGDYRVSTDDLAARIRDAWSA